MMELLDKIDPKLDQRIKIGNDDTENEGIVKELVQQTIERLRTINCSAMPSQELKQELKANFDLAMKNYFAFRESDYARQWEKFRGVLIADLKTTFSDFCLDFTNKISAFLSEVGSDFRSQVQAAVNSQCLPPENLNKIISSVKAKVVQQYQGSAMVDLDQLTNRLDEEKKIFTAENDWRLKEIDSRYNAIFNDLLQKYEFLAEMRLPDDELDTASDRKLESTLEFCKKGVLVELNEKMQFDSPEIKAMFENKITVVVNERFSQKIIASKKLKENKFMEASEVVNNAVESFAKSMSAVFKEVSNDTELNNVRNAKINELKGSLTENIYDILPDRKDAKQMLDLAKQKMDKAFLDLQNQRDAQTQEFQKQWEAELNSICETLHQRFDLICQSDTLQEVEDLRAERDIIICELIRGIDWLNDDNKDLLESFRKAAIEQMETLSSPFFDVHSKKLQDSFDDQKYVMNECSNDYEAKLKELLKNELNDDIYVIAKTIGEATVARFEARIRNIVPIYPAATITLRKDLKNEISRIHNQFESEVKDRHLMINAVASQLITDVLNDYKQLLDAYSIASNFADEKMSQIHFNLKTRAQQNLQKDLRLAKYSGNITEQQRKLEELIDKAYNDTTVVMNSHRADWSQKLESCNQKASIMYKQMLISNMGRASNEDDLQKLHEEFKEKAIASWEDLFPVQYFSDKLLPERRKFAKQLDNEFATSISQMWQQSNLDIDRNTRNAVEKFVKEYEDKMNSTLAHLDYTSDEAILKKHEQLSKEAIQKLNNVEKPKTISKKVYDDLLSTRLENTLDCFRVQNSQKKETIQSDISNEITKFKDALRRDVLNLQVFPEKTSQLVEANKEQAKQLLNRYKIRAEFKQQLAVLTEEKLIDTFNDIKSEWDNIQPDPNQLQLAINFAVNEYNKEMENRISKTGQIFRSKAMKKHHAHSLKIVQKKFVESVKQTSEAQKQFEKAIAEVLKKFEDHNDLRAAEHSEAAIGIDLGTTFSCVAIYKGGKIEMIPDREHHSNTVPSYVFYESANKTVVGHSAKDQSVIHPQTTIFDSKRLIGRKFYDDQIQKDMTQWPFNVVPDPDVNRKEPKIKVFGETFHPEEVSGEILKHLKKNAEVYLDRAVKDVVITVPAYFNDAQKRATKNAAAFANINVLEIINEPTSAAIAYSLNYTDGKNKNILVFDLGGGTFDVSILSTEKCNIKVRAVLGDNHLGGEDFDSNMVDFCIEKFRQNTGLTIPKNVSSSLAAAAAAEVDEEVEQEEARKVFETLRRLRQKCELAKINLSKTEKVRVVVDYIYKQKNMDVEITVEEFNKINEKLFDKCIKIVEQTVVDSKLTKAQIDDVVLVGGSSRIPEVQRLLSEFFEGKSLIMTLNPDEVVAQGAAYRAAMISGSRSRELADIQFQDVNPLSLGVEVIGEKFSVILPKNTPLPAKRTETYVTTKNYQTEIKISIYEGDDEENIANNNLLGEFTLSNIPSKRKGQEPIDVTIECDDEGLIHVTAKVRSNNQSGDIKIQSNRGGLSEDDIKAAMSRYKTPAS